MNIARQWFEQPPPILGGAPHLKHFASFPVSVAYVDITTWCGSLYRLGLGRYIDRGRVVISSVRWSIYRQVPTRSIGLPKSIYCPCDFLRAIIWLPWHSRYVRPRVETLSVLLGETLRLTCIKVGRRVVRSRAESCLKYGGETERGGRITVRTRLGSLAGLMRRYSTPLAISVDRLGRFGQPTWGTSVDRLGLFGGPTAALRSTDIADSVDRVCQPPGEVSIPAKGRINTTVGSDQYHGMVGSIRRYRRFLRYRLIESSIRPCRDVEPLSNIGVEVWEFGIILPERRVIWIRLGIWI